MRGLFASGVNMLDSESLHPNLESYVNELINEIRGIQV